ncbi:ATP synthase protein MI25-like [Bidens hawaiensis]|uniref:ATP synthase protein MI25-like n=1 Tax=Bidens hawaiensis TaxID=980011 RepID=UPI00404B9433
MGLKDKSAHNMLRLDVVVSLCRPKRDEHRPTLVFLFILGGFVVYTTTKVVVVVVVVVGGGGGGSIFLFVIARCFIGFIIFSRKSLGKTFKVTLDGIIQAIQEESRQFLNPNEVVPPESNEQQRLLRISLRICGTVVESLPMAHSAPKCEKTVQALLCRNQNVKSATLPNATSSRRIRLQDDLVTGFHFSVSERFVPGSPLKASIVELIREGLVVLRRVRVGAE